MVLFAVILIFSRKSPVIQSLDPSMAAPGQEVVLTGSYFGRTVRDGTLTLAGNVILPSSIIKWSDHRIAFKVPSDALSGLLTIANSQGVSKGLLFTNTNEIPMVWTPALNTLQPYIEAVTPASPVTGTVLTLRATRIPDHEAGCYVELRAPHQPSVHFHDFVSWNPRSVQIRLPVGYGPGTQLVFHTPEGNSPPFDLGATSPAEWQNPVTYKLTFEADCEFSSGTGDAMFWLNLPDPSQSLQPYQVSFSKQPLPGSQGELLPFAFPDAGGTQSLTFTLQLTAREFHWVGTSGSNTPSGSSASNSKAPAQASLGWGSAWDSWQEATWQVPSQTWAAAQQVYQKVLAHFSGVKGSDGLAKPATPDQVWQNSTPTPFELTLTYAAALKSVNIVSRVVAGFLVQGNTAQPHTWVEFWDPGAGWIPADPALGLGTANPLTQFSALDNRHIFWSAGPVLIERGETASHLVDQLVPFSFQRSFIEVNGGLHGSVLWHEVSVNS